jgi:hypothetical protein
MLNEDAQTTQEQESLEGQTNEVKATENTETTPSVEETTPDVEALASTEPTAVVEEVTPEVEAVESTEPTAVIEEVTPEVETVESTETATPVAEEIPEAKADYSGFTKEQIIDLLEKTLTSVKAEPSVGAFRKSEDMLKEVKPLFEAIRAQEKKEALDKFVAENQTEEGFELKTDASNEVFDRLFRQLKEQRNGFYQELDKERDKNFTKKTDLLQKLRDLVESVEQSSEPEVVKSSFNGFREIQEEWKAAGNVASQHNMTLWQTYNALVDRYYSQRNLYFEMLEMDRKKNLQVKIELCDRLEKIVTQVNTTGINKELMDEAIGIFDEFKAVGPAPKEANELVWERAKTAINTVYDKRREQTETDKAAAEENFKKKSEIVALVEPFATFNSEIITEWNERTKALLALQDQFNGIKGYLPRESGRDINQEFWNSIKAFFKNKNEFFENLEAKRSENLAAKLAIIEKIEAYLNADDTSAEATDDVIKLQKEFRTIGFVPEKDRDTIFDRFKKSTDGFFEKKRGSKSSDYEKEYDENLQKKVALCEQIEAEASTSPDLSKVAGFKASFAQIGFVPRKNMQEIQRRFADAINAYIKGVAKISGKAPEQLLKENEVTPFRRDRENSNFVPRQDSNKREPDIKKKIQYLENDIATWKNNLEFFARSKNAEQLRADFESRITKAEAELKALQQKLKEGAGS